MNINNLVTFYDINMGCPPGRIVVSHDSDVNTRTVEVFFRQGVIPLAISTDCIAKAAFVERQSNILINDNVPCTVTEAGSVLIPVDDLHRQGRFDMSIELTVTNQDGEKVLATPFPMWITVNGSILNEAEVTEESKGTVPELLEAAEEALDLAGIESGEVNENGTITFTRPNGTTFTTTGEGVIGKQGNSVTNAEILNNNLIIHIGVLQPDGTILDTPVDVGRVVGQTGKKGQHGDGYIAAQINADGDLIMTEVVYTAHGSTPMTRQINLGHVVGAKGEKGDKGDPGAQGIQGESGAQGVPGTNGKDGADGYSPSAAVSKSGGTATITITDKNGTTTATVTDGAKGDKGEPGTNGTDGAKGDKGDKGDPGANGVSCTHSWSGTTLSVTSASGTSSANLKGAKGDKGDTGEQGLPGAKGDKGDPGDDYVLTAADKTAIATEAAGMIDVSGKADKATTLSGYGISNAYTKTQTNNLLNAKESTANKVTAVDSSATDTQYPSAKAVYQIVSTVANNGEVKANKVTAITSSSNDTQYPSAKAVYTGLSDKADKSDTYTKSEVDSLVSGGVVPQYVIDEAESVLAKAFAHKGLGRTIRFIAVSDSHNDATEASYAYTRVSNQHCGQAVKYIADRIPLDFVASLGDMTWAGVVHTTAQYQTDWLKDDIQEMNLFLKDGFSGVPNIRVVGNHDQCATTDSGGTVSRLQNSGAYQYFGRYNAGVSDGLSNYGYYDLDNVKVRIIYLNTSDTVNVSSQGTYLGMTADQKNWLCETLIDLNAKTDAASWKILLMSHAPLDMISGLAADILIPYTNGGTYGSYTFTNHSAKIIGNCHGHTHCYNVGYISDKIRRFTIPNSNFYDNNHYKNNANYAAWTEETTYPKTQNSRTDTSFSLVTIDLDSLTCYVDNYGAGYDREFSLDYNNVSPTYTNQIPISVDTDGNIYNGTGYKDDTGISSSGVERTKTGNLATGYIPYNYGDTIRIDRFDTTASGDKNNGGVFFYNASKTYLGAKRLPTYVTEGKIIDGEPLVDTPVSPIYDNGAGADKVITTAAFIRVVFYDKSGQGENLIVTINEVI